jgi:transcription elongation factor GreA-like protein
MTDQGGRALEPGQWVRHPVRQDWGIGQVQSVIGQRVTVNFENAGKVLVNIAVIALEPLEDPLGARSAP